MSKAISINKSGFFAIEGRDNSCYLNLLFKLKNIYSKKELLFITTKNIDFLKSDLEKIKSNFDDFDKLNSDIRYLFLKSDFHALYKEYGSEFLIKEITTLIGEDEIDFIYFHKIDFLLHNDYDYSKVLIDVISSIKYHNKKLVFSYNPDTKNGSAIQNIIKNEVDVKLLLDSNNKKCSYEIESNNDLQIKAKVVFICDSDEIFKIHDYIFNKNKNISFIYIDPYDMQKNIHDVFYTTNFLIYKGFDKTVVNTIVQYIKSNNLDIKFIYICDINHVRKDDNRDFKRLGIYKIFERDFDLNEYIYTLSNLLKYNHYYTKMRLLTDSRSTTITTKKNNFEDYIKYLLEKRIFFSILLFKVEDDLSMTKIELKNLIRNQDFIYFDEKDKILMFVCMNILPKTVRHLIEIRAIKENIDIKFEQDLMSIDI